MKLRILLFVLSVAAMAAFGLFTQASAHGGGGHGHGGHGGHWGGHGWHGGGWLGGDWDDDEFCEWRHLHGRRVWVCE